MCPAFPTGRAGFRWRSSLHWPLWHAPWTPHLASSLQNHSQPWRKPYHRWVLSNKSLMCKILFYFSVQVLGSDTVLLMQEDLGQNCPINRDSVSLYRMESCLSKSNKDTSMFLEQLTSLTLLKIKELMVPNLTAIILPPEYVCVSGWILTWNDAKHFFKRVIQIMSVSYFLHQNIKCIKVSVDAIYPCRKKYFSSMFSSNFTVEKSVLL